MKPVVVLLAFRLAALSGTTEFDASNNPLGWLKDEMIPTITKVMGEFGSLESFYLENTQISNEGQLAIACATTDKPLVSQSVRMLPCDGSDLPTDVKEVFDQSNSFVTNTVFRGLVIHLPDALSAIAYDYTDPGVDYSNGITVIGDNNGGL